MKRAVIVALTLSMILLASAAVVSASILTELSVSPMLSVGEEIIPSESIFHFSDQYGVPLQVIGTEIQAYENEPMHVQVSLGAIKGDKTAFVEYTTEALVDKMNRSSFDEYQGRGWYFTLEPRDIEQSDGFVRHLQMRTVNREGKRKWIRFIFKGTVKGWSENNNLFSIRTIPRSQSPADIAAASNARLDDLEGRVSKAEEHISTAEGNIKSLGTVVTAQTKEIRNLQDWVIRAKSGTASMPTGTAVPTNNVAQANYSSRMVTFKVKFIGDFIGVWMEITRSDGKKDTYDAKRVGQMVTLPCGLNSFDLWVDYGNGDIKKKKTIPVEIDPSTTDLELTVSYQGGVGR